MAGDPHSVSEILDRLRDMGANAHRDPVELGEAVEAFGKRSVGPFLLVPALIEVSPIGGIPAVPTLLAIIIALSAAQILFGRDHVWLPGFLERRHVKGDKVVKPMPDTRIEEGDIVLIFALSKDIPEVERLLQVSIDFF